MLLDLSQLLHGFVKVVYMDPLPNKTKLKFGLCIGDPKYLGKVDISVLNICLYIYARLEDMICMMR